MNGSVCIFGEVLFDCFPDGRRVLGGAPFNVAWHLQAFGEAPFFISRVGRDSDGAAVRAAMSDWGMNLNGLGTDDHLPTGQVKVEIDDGEPAYDIVHPAAWDAIRLEMVPDCALLYHGSLALREDGSRQAWRQIRASDPGLVFVDVNLRPPWWTKQLVFENIDGADWVKLNRPELDLITPGGGDVQSRAAELMHKHRLRGLLLTEGSRGASLFTSDGGRLATRPASGIVITDTVGAGDAMAAVMMLGLIRDWPLDVTLGRAQDFASALVEVQGATVRDPAFYNRFLNGWVADPAGDH